VTLAETNQPVDGRELSELVAYAAQKAYPLEARAGGTKRDVGSPDRIVATVDLSRFRGVVDYDPSELVLTVRPATPLAELEELLRESNQMLAFEPWDPGPVFGYPATATIGGVVASGIAGSRRVSAGAARDHLLGFAAISGRGEAFKAGGKVVKNVTGFDVSKLMANSWGQLAILTELTLKVVPRPRAVATIALTDLPVEAAIAAMSKAMGAPYSVAAAVHLPAANGTRAMTGLRLEGFPKSVETRGDHLRALLADFGDPCQLADKAADAFWQVVREAQPLSAAETLWRVHVAASRAAGLVQELERCGAFWFFDWAGSLIWAGAPAVVDVHSAAQSYRGHAMLLRAPHALRRTIGARHPQPPGVAALSARVKRAFDPAGILDPRRFA
jgi:glycolate dehydrogenase FAD-binding subunit